jgi:DNA-directed RNA polymerase specialized sigma24 family protein
MARHRLRPALDEHAFADHNWAIMSTPGSISQWLDQLKKGDPAAAQPLWEGFFGRLVGLARAKLQGVPRRAADEEDVALSAFDSFCRGAEAGRYPKLTDRHDLWQLLVVITARKACDLVQHERRHKRGGGRVQDEAALAVNDRGDVQMLAEAMGQEPSPELAAQFAEQCRCLLDRLEDPTLRRVAVWKLEGFRNEEIAAKLGRSLPTVERKLQRIRGIWREHLK